MQEASTSMMTTISEMRSCRAESLLKLLATFPLTLKALSRAFLRIVLLYYTFIHVCILFVSLVVVVMANHRHRLFCWLVSFCTRVVCV